MCMSEWLHHRRYSEDALFSETKAITHTLRAVVFLVLHEVDSGEERYPAVRDTLIGRRSRTDGTDR